MNIIYGILSVVGWVWCGVALTFLFFKLKGPASGQK
jgi:hypothetical protein